MEEKVVNTEATATPVQETPKGTTPEPKTEPQQTQSGEVVKETPKEVVVDKVPYSRFSEVIAQKNEATKRAQELEARLKDIEQRATPRQEEVDLYAGMSQEEKEQTEKFIEKFVEPRIMKKFQPFIQEVQNEKLNKQVAEAKNFASKVGINFDERLPEIVDYLSRPENKGRLTAKEALLSLYGDEFLEKSTLQGKESISRETQELMEKKKLANANIPSVNTNSVVQTDEMARRSMSSQDRLQYDLKKAYDMAQQGVKNPKVGFE